MNRYQKVITCVIRSLAVGGLLYAIGALLVMAIMGAQMLKLGLFTVAPVMVVSLLLFLAAIPLAKLITMGVRDD